VLREELIFVGTCDIAGHVRGKGFPARELAARKKQGIGCGVYYPIPVHLQPAYAGHPARVPLPISDRASREVLSLPMFAELPESDVARAVDAVRRFLK